MTSYVSTNVGEGHSTHRPPLFNGSNYGYWKIKMRIFLQANDFKSWRVVENGPYVSSKIVDGVSVPKPSNEWNEIDIARFQANDKAMNSLICAL